jgi:hypothetical protein
VEGAANEASIGDDEALRVEGIEQLMDEAESVTSVGVSRRIAFRRWC